MNWKIGDIAIILYTPGGKSIGNEVEILSQLRPAKKTLPNGGIRDGDPVHEISGRPRVLGRTCVSKPEWLGKLPPANEITSWSDCIWQPKELVSG